MIRYATTRVGFGSSQASEKLKANSNRVASALTSNQSGLNATTSALVSAQVNNISGRANLAARAAIARVQAEAKAKREEALKQIDSAQAALDASKTVDKTKPTIIGNTVIQKYVSWALTPTVDTTA